METPAYEGGIGGKFRKRPLRRAPATPYDRPPSAARDGLRGLPDAAGNSRWLSKLVDPASRLIAGGASRIFASFFRKRLAPPDAPEETHQSRQEVPEVGCVNPSSEQNPSSELQVQERNGGDEPTKKSDTNNSDTDGISELEQLLKQKTFTRVEFDHLMELLRSRTVEPVTFEPVVDNEKRKIGASAQENGVGNSRLHENFSVPADSSTITKDEAASPMELAKAYMVSRPLKGPPSTLSLRSQVFQEDTALPSIVPYVSKPFNLSVAPRPLICSSGIPELPENSYQTPKPWGRSAICRMSCSPYFKAHSTTNVKGGGATGDVYTGPSSSQLTPRNLMHSGGRQVLKRRSSVLDGDLGSFGPIRRIRQKSYMMSPSNDSYSTLLNKDVIEGSSSIHKPSKLDGSKYHTTVSRDAQYEDNKISYARVTPIPPKSSETAMKILQQLDKLMPSPKEKSSELKAIAKEELHSHLTQNMLDGRARRNMEDIDPSKSFNVQDCGSLDTNRDSQLLNLRNSLSKKQYRVEENGSSKPAVSGVKLTSEACSIVNAAVPSTEAEPGTRILDFSISGSAALPRRENPSFQMSTPKDSLVPDDNNHNTRDSSDPLSNKMDKFESKILKRKTAISETAISEKSLLSSSRSMPGSSSIFFSEVDMKASGSPSVADKNTGFTFPVASGPSTHSQRPPTPTMPAPSLDKSALQKEQTVAPGFSFVSKAAHTLTFSSTMTNIGDTAGQKVGASDATTASTIEGSNLGGEMLKAEILSKSFGNAASSGIPTTTVSAVFGFGASTSPSQSNGSLHLSSLTSSLSAAPVVTHSDSRASSTFFTSTATTTSTSSPSISSAAHIFSTVNSFQFGSSTSTGAPVSVSHPVNKSDSTNLEMKPVKALTFSTSSSTAPYTSSFSSTGSSSSSTLTTFAFSGSECGSSPPATSAAFPGAGSSSSPLALSPTFSSTSRGIFGFSASSQPSTSSFSFASNSSQNSTTTSDATAGSIFGTQSTQSGSGSPQFPQSSTSQFGSLSSPSSSGFGSSLFGPATSGTKPFTSSGFAFSDGSVSSSSGTNSSFLPAAAASLFGPSSPTLTSSASGFTFGSTPSSTSMGLSFGQSSFASGSSSLTFGSPTGTVFSFTSAGSTISSASSLARPVFGMPTPAVGFSSGSPGNDQMNVEGSMTNNTNQAAIPMASTFGRPANSPAVPNSVFDSAAIPSGGPPVFQFVGHQNPSSTQSPFQAGNLVPLGGGFSVGSGGGDKSGRKIVKVKRDKQRKM